MTLADDFDVIPGDRFLCRGQLGPTFETTVLGVAKGPLLGHVVVVEVPAEYRDCGCATCPSKRTIYVRALRSCAVRRIS